MEVRSAGEKVYINRCTCLIALPIYSRNQVYGAQYLN